MTTPPEAPEVEPAEPEVPLLQLRDGPSAVVETAEQLSTVVDRFAAGHGPCAIDAERASGHRYSQRAYLVQLRREGAGTALIDPVGFGPVPNESLSPLREALVDSEWIIHAASQDVHCLAELGLRPAQLFDTELAGRLLNYPRVGLAALVEELLGYRMRKEHSAVDWSKRPLPEPWLLYAALDVEMLIELRDILAGQLRDEGKVEWAAEEFAYWAAIPAANTRREPWRRTSGLHRVRGPRGLGLVRAMWETRDLLARGRDITSSRILTDAAIVEAARAAPDSRNALARLPTFATRSGQRYLGDFYAAIERATRLPPAELPATSPDYDGPPPARSWADRNPAAAQRLNRCREAINELASRYQLPQENLITPDTVRRVAWQPPLPLDEPTVARVLAEHGARRWQVRLVAATLADALAEAPAEAPAETPAGAPADDALPD